LPLDFGGTIVKESPHRFVEQPIEQDNKENKVNGLGEEYILVNQT
jgi:hypothetical protein